MIDNYLNKKYSRHFSIEDSHFSKNYDKMEISARSPYARLNSSSSNNYRLYVIPEAHLKVHIAPFISIKLENIICI